MALTGHLPKLLRLILSGAVPAICLNSMHRDTSPLQLPTFKYSNNRQNWFRFVSRG